MNAVSGKCNTCQQPLVQVQGDPDEDGMQLVFRTYHPAVIVRLMSPLCSALLPFPDMPEGSDPVLSFDVPGSEFIENVREDVESEESGE